MSKTKTIFPFIAVISLSYYFLPSPLMLVWVIPLFCCILAFIYGINNSFNPLFALFVVVLFVPLVLAIFPPSSALFYAIGYGIMALFGNVIGMILHKHSIRIKYPAKFSRYLIITVVGSYILTLILSAIMMSQMTQITYHATDHGVTIREDIIDFDTTNAAKRNYYDYYGNPQEKIETSISNSEKFKIKVICSFSLFPLWHEYYDNPNVMDGDQYHIVRSYEKGESVIYGGNAYPITYILVFNAINNVFD